jgi:hypothetical protein
MMANGWTCPYCNRAATVTRENHTTGFSTFDDNNKEGVRLGIATSTITCPNLDCREYIMEAELYRTEHNGTWKPVGEPIMSWQLRPQSTARPFPDYIPAPLLGDYTEACLIRDLSPKASATLARRCLQGMIRDFWGVKERTLFDEINAIKDKVDPAIWKAIDAVRSIGNIGAHMEKDIDLVIDVDPDEAQTLIQLIEVLFEEWYIARQQRAEHLAKIVAIADAKKIQKASQGQVE